MIGDNNPLPFQVGGGPSRVESYFAAFKSIVGVNGHSKDDFSLEAEWRKSRALALAALATFDERAMLQAFPHKATDHLELYEKLHAIESDPTKSNEQRRNLIVPNHVATPESWWSALTAQLQEIDTRITMRVVEHAHESTTVVGRTLRPTPDVSSSPYGRSCASFPNVSSSFTVFVLFDTGGGVPIQSDLDKRAEIVDRLASALPSWCDWRVSFTTGFILDVSPLDITAFGPRGIKELGGTGLARVVASGSLEVSTSIARILTGEFRGSDLWHLFALTDSRLTHKESAFMTTCPEVAWGGCEIPYLVGLASSPGGAHSVGVATPASVADARQTAAGVSGYVGTYAPLSAYVTTFSGGAEPNDGTIFATRMWFASTQLNQALAPLLWTALESQDVQYRTIYRKLSDGTSTDWALSFRAAVSGSFSPPNYQSAYVASSNGSPAYGTISATIPSAHNWATNNDPTFEIIAKPGDATVSGEKLLLCSPGWLEGTSGVVLHMHGIGGKSVDGFLDNDVFAPALATDYYPLHGANRLFWLDLGSNNPALNSAAQHAAKMTSLIERVRAGSPGVYIVLTTAYWYGGGTPSGADPYWVQGSRTVRDTVEGVLMLDTYNAMPTYDAAFAAGLHDIGDTVHYNPVGVAYYAQCIGDLIKAEATHSTSPSQFGTLFFGYDSTRMIESVGVPVSWDADSAGSFTGDLTVGTGTLAYAGGGWGIEHAPTVYRTATPGTLDLAGVQDYSVAVIFSMATLADRRLLSDQIVASGTSRAWDVHLNADGSLGLYIRPTNGGTLWAVTTAAGTVQAGVRTVVQLQRIGSTMLLFVNGVQVAYGDVGAAAATGGGSYGPAIGGYAFGGSSSSGTFVCRAMFAWKQAVNPRAVWRWAQRKFGV